MLLRAARKKWQEHKVSGSSETVLSLSLSEGNGNPLQDSCLGNSMDGGAWQATVHGVAKSQTQLERLSMQAKGFDVVLVFHARLMSLCLL